MKIRLYLILLLTTISCNACFYTKIPDLPKTVEVVKEVPFNGFIAHIDLPKSLKELLVIENGVIMNPKDVVREYAATRKVINDFNEKKYECR